MVFGCGVPSLVEDVNTILVTCKSEVDDGDVGAAAAASLEEVVDARTSEGACEVVDIEVAVVSTIRAVLEADGTAPRGVDRTT